MKKRLDQILLDESLVENRSKARSLIIDGRVIVNNDKETKPGTLFDSEKIIINIIGVDNEFVSRAGKKLDKAVKIWNINLDNKICLDIGSSTGGFTDCCLQNKASLVYAVDVGTNQLDWKLRQDPRVIVLEKTNFRNVTIDIFDKGEIDFFCCDVSFISVSKILPALKTILKKQAIGVILIKPQFESDRGVVNNGRVVGVENHINSIKKVFSSALENSFSILEIDFSPILGNKKSNIEYITKLEFSLSPEIKITENQIFNVVKNAHELLLKKKDDVNV
ncbi:rRNA methyltransferase [Spiroplasma sabaudiense Ar-1343]|uniref:rRNA methyltransferase n=1 Tax=Spiroplasma sabaudiense Ar-1343 TaxID=1276257 RepID=W6AJJ6_9MOLU|nr:TlyA family RNA methyltransferase [Spiroplasma sabaudiense]AHI53894.1 rRNA methyltransferase [Spiroplasma sabaudiense Ar-1343]